jgi:hypothetical protein
LLIADEIANWRMPIVLLQITIAALLSELPNAQSAISNQKSAIP